MLNQDQQIIKGLLDQTILMTEFVNSEELESMTRSVASLTATFYNQLVEDGVPPDAAAVVAASYSTNVVPTK